MKIWAWAGCAGNRIGGIPQRRGSRVGRCIVTLFTGMVLLLAACGRLPPLPGQVESKAYSPIVYQELLAPGAARLQAGQKIKVPAYFWEFLSYDPATVRNYLNMIGHPLSWPRLEWFATYGTPDLKGYFDLAALDPALKKALPLHRLDHIMIYGELAPLGPGLYLRVHRIEKIEED